MKIRNKILAVFFVVFLVYSTWNLIANGTAQEVLNTAWNRISSFGQASPVSATATVSEALGSASETISCALPYQVDFIELNGFILHAAGTRSYYNEEYGINVSTDGYIVGKYDYTSTDYEVEQMLSLKEFLDEKKIQLLYVNEPIKYIDDDYYTEQFGGESFINRNADLFLSRISDAEIDCLDLRDCITTEGIDPASLFYKADHHWTVPASKWAAFKIAEKLNSCCGYNIDLSLYDDNNFNVIEYSESWLGEQGRLIAKDYLGLEDYAILEPLYPTEYTVFSYAQDVLAQGDFGIFIDKASCKVPDSYYTGFLWHYVYRSYSPNIIYNHNADYGNVLVLGDSYEVSMLPFLSLGIQNLQTICLRHFDGDIRAYIEAGDYDTIIVAYAQFMIGAHDDETNANYRMFDFQ